jgi:hypothetical protein
MTWNTVMGFISSAALLMPIILMLSFRLGTYKTFPALLSYYAIFFIYNLLTEGYLNTSTDTVNNWNICKNILDAPLMLTFLAYFSTSALFTKKLKIGLVIMICYEIVIVSVKGFTTDAITLILGPVLLSIFFLAAYLFIRQTKISISHGKASGRATIAASVLFAYGCYTIIYLMYYVFKTPYVADTFLVYFLVTTFSSLVMCAGIIVERKRIQKLTELKITRKELSDIYKDSSTTAPLRTVVLDFDKDQWN